METIRADREVQHSCRPQDMATEILRQTNVLRQIHLTRAVGLARLGHLLDAVQVSIDRFRQVDSETGEEWVPTVDPVALTVMAQAQCLVDCIRQVAEEVDAELACLVLENTRPRGEPNFGSHQGHALNRYVSLEWRECAEATVPSP